MGKRRESMEDGDALLLKNNVNYERERDREWEREGRDTVMPGDRKSMVSIERNGRYYSG